MFCSVKISLVCICSPSHSLSSLLCSLSFSFFSNFTHSHHLFFLLFIFLPNVFLSVCMFGCACIHLSLLVCSCVFVFISLPPILYFSVISFYNLRMCLCQSIHLSVCLSFFLPLSVFVVFSLSLSLLLYISITYKSINGFCLFLWLFALFRGEDGVIERMCRRSLENKKKKKRSLRPNRIKLSALQVQNKFRGKQKTKKAFNIERI